MQGLWMGIHSATVQFQIDDNLPEPLEKAMSRECTYSQLSIGMVVGSVLGILFSIETIFNFEIIGIEFNKTTTAANFSLLVLVATVVLVQKCFHDKTRTHSISIYGT